MTLLDRRLALAGLTAALLFPAAARGAAPRPPVTVHKDPNCGCCDGWADHLRRAGFAVSIVLNTDLQALRARLGVPEDLASCHTAELDGYLLEGHVPVRAIERLLRERPQARGLSVPGMPLGSPGMGGEPEDYEVVLFGPQGLRSYGRFRGTREV